MQLRRINVLGVGINVLTLDTAVQAVEEALLEGRQGYVTVTGVHGVSECQSDVELRRIHNESYLSTPDGMPLTWLGRLQGFGPAEMDRVYGPDLMKRIVAGSEVENPEVPLRHFFCGGREGVAEQLRARLLQEHPRATIVGTYTPPFRPLSKAEELQLVRQLVNSRANCLWVGLSTPKQERFMADLLTRYGENSKAEIRLPAPLLMFGVGAAFDFHAGLVPQAPYWVQRAGMEWAFRLSKEPRRLWRRYIKNNPLFLARIAMQLTGLKKYPLPEGPTPPARA